MSSKPQTPCVEHRQNRRYGVTRRDGRFVSTHVAVWEAEYGPKPEGLQVDHLCGNCRCIRLDHLEAVTPQENVRRSRATRLALDVVRQIRAEYAVLPRADRKPWVKRTTSRPVKVARGARQELAAKHGISPRHLHRIVTGALWQE